MVIEKQISLFQTRNRNTEKTPAQHRKVKAQIKSLIF